MPDFMDRTYYSAILIHPSLASPVLIPLFESRKLAQYVTDTLRNRSDFANQLYIKDGHNLYELIWAPLSPYLSDIKTIYFSSSGLIHLINLNAIPTTKNKILADEYDIPFLGQIPLVQSIREGGDLGIPVMMGDESITKKAYAERIIK